MDNTKIDALEIQYFKCFEALQLPLGQLTILSGRNSAGKSAAIQSLLLFSQALKKAEKYEEALVWPLNGDFVRLGTCGEILNLASSSVKFKFSFSKSKQPLEFKLVAESRERNLKPLKSPKKILPKDYALITQIQYLSALRGGIIENSSKPDDINFYKEGLGIDGRFSGYWCDVFSDEPIDDGKCLDGSENKVFDLQVNAWLGFIAPGTVANIENVDKSPNVSIQFRQSYTGEWRSPANVGVGISYVFPIIVSLLAAKPGDCVIIDSPEAHLHPQAQSRVGRMLTQFATTGIQIIIETHSDHVLNGIRIAVKNKVLNPDNVSILFFSGISAEDHGVFSTQIDREGQIEHWPNGFFDQIDKDIVTLLEI